MPKLRSLIRAISNRNGPEAFALARKSFDYIFRQHYPFHWPNLEWMSDQVFWGLLENYGEANGLNSHRRKVLLEFALYAVEKVGGDTAECGAYRGLGSHLICMAVRERGNSGARHYIFDSFEGLSMPSAEDGSYWAKGNLACDEMTVRDNLKEFDFVVYSKGWIPARFSDVASRRFGFVHIDVDLASPTKDSLDFFFPRLNSGGVIIVDDYGSAWCPGVTAVVERFVSANPEASLISLPVGGGIIMKCVASVPTAPLR